MDVNPPRKLFHKAIMDSGAHTARAMHPPQSKLNQQHFRELLDLTPCAKYQNLLDPEILTCLRNLPSEVVDEAGKAVFARSDLSKTAFPASSTTSEGRFRKQVNISGSRRF